MTRLRPSLLTKAGFLGLLLLLPFVAQHFLVAKAAEPEPRCNYVAAYGAVSELSTGSEVKPTLDTIEPIIGHLLACAEQNLSAAESSAYQQQRKPAPNAGEDAMQRIKGMLDRIDLAAGLSANEVVGEQSRIARRLLAEIGKGDGSAAVPQRAAASLLATSAVTPATARANHKDQVATYQQNCRDNGVPVPGALATDANWSAPINLDADKGKYFFAREKTILKMWTYRAQDKGFCISLLRQAPNETDLPPFIGTICTDKDLKHACFFDNETYKDDGSAELVTEAAMTTTDYSKLVHPLDAVDKCNMCHIGGNAFIVHPAMVLGRTIKAMYPPATGSIPPNFEFVPFGGTLRPWKNPPSLSVAGTGDGEDGACARCHTIPNAIKNRDFCGILQNAAGRTMPPTWDPRGEHPVHLWPDDNGCFDDSLKDLKPYFESVRRLRAMCLDEPVKACSAQ